MNIAGRFFSILAAFCVTSLSCGIENETFLTEPTILDTQTNTVLSLTHDPTTYASALTNFIGYEIYYKFYPSSPTQTSENLNADRDTLATTPTKDKLLSMGYQRLNLVDLFRSPEPINNLGEIGRSKSGAKVVVTLEYTAFFNQIVTNSSLDPFPKPQMIVRDVSSGNILSQKDLFRGILLNGKFATFRDLYSVNDSGFVYSGDMSSSINATSPSNNKYEACFFIAAYSWTPEKVLYSKPVPWGIIRDFSVALP